MSLHRRIKDVDPSVVGVDAEVDFSTHASWTIFHRRHKNSTLYASISILSASLKMSTYFFVAQKTVEFIKVRDLSFLHRLAREELESNNI